MNNVITFNNGQCSYPGNVYLFKFNNKNTRNGVKFVQI